MITELLVKLIPQENGVSEFHIYAAPGWDDFESIIQFMTINYPAKIIDDLDGICSRTWRLEIDNIEFYFKHHDDIGNYFYTSETGVKEEKLAKNIADALSERLREIKP